MWSGLQSKVADSESFIIRPADEKLQGHTGTKSSEEHRSSLGRKENMYVVKEKGASWDSQDPGNRNTRTRWSRNTPVGKLLFVGWLAA